jgi:hypothetical protein
MNPITPSNTTQRLIELLTSRDAAGQAKYGHTLDRADLLAEDWAQHATEEALDMAGYLARFAQTASALRAENVRLAEENLCLRSVILPLVRLAKTLDIESSAPIKLPETVGINTEKLSEVPSPLPSVSEPMPTVVATPAPVASAPLTTAETVPAGCIGAVEASERMGVARNTISGWVKRGYLPWAGSYRTSSGAMGKYVRISELDAVPAMLERVEEERKRKSGNALRQVPTDVRAQQIKDAVATKRDTERPEGGVSYAEAGKFLDISPDSVRAYAKRGLLERIGETPYVTRASVLARKESMLVGAAPAAAFDPNENGRYEAIEHGRSLFHADKAFDLHRVIDGNRYKWLAIGKDKSYLLGESELVERWGLNGLGRWESTPVIPGMVGMGNGVTKGTRGYTVPVLG